MEIIEMLRKYLKEWKKVSGNRPAEFKSRGWNASDNDIKSIQNSVRFMVQANEEAIMEALTEEEKAQVKEILSYVD